MKMKSSKTNQPQIIETTNLVSKAAVTATAASLNSLHHKYAIKYNKRKRKKKMKIFIENYITNTTKSTSKQHTKIKCEQKKTLKRQEDDDDVDGTN